MAKKGIAQVEHVALSHKTRPSTTVRKSIWEDDKRRKALIAEGYFLTDPEQVKEDLELQPLTEDQQTGEGS